LLARVAPPHQPAQGKGRVVAKYADWAMRYTMLKIAFVVPSSAIVDAWSA
jgi:hypothetical protein